MELAQVLHILWRRRPFVAVGVLGALIAGLAISYHISLSPLGLQKKHLSIAQADTQVLVDTSYSTLAVVGSDTKPLADKASVYAEFMTTRPVRQAIAHAAGLREDQLVVTAPLNETIVPKQAIEPTASKRTDQLLSETDQYRLTLTTDPGTPTITLTAQAPTVPDAEHLADAAARGFRGFVVGLENRQRVPLHDRVVIRTLGHAVGGVLAKSVNVPLTILTFLGVLVAWSLLVLLGDNVVTSWRQLRELEELGPDEPNQQASA
jgi:hypothetical protein